MREQAGGLARERGIQELRRELILVVSASIEETQYGSSWRVAAKRISWRCRLRG
jgi:hypothetical protein